MQLTHGLSLIEHMLHFFIIIFSRVHVVAQRWPFRFFVIKCRWTCCFPTSDWEYCPHKETLICLFYHHPVSGPTALKKEVFRFTLCVSAITNVIGSTHTQANTVFLHSISPQNTKLVGARFRTAWSWENVAFSLIWLIQIQK